MGGIGPTVTLTTEPCTVRGYHGSTPLGKDGGMSWKQYSIGGGGGGGGGGNVGGGGNF